MLNVKTNPVGIDSVIQDFLEFMHDRLLRKWSIQSDKYKCYGRCYKNRKTNGFVAELYTSGKDYKDAYWEDSLTALSFFGVNDVRDFKGNQRTEIHLVFFVNIDKIYTDKTHRADEEIRSDVLNIISESTFNTALSGIVTGVEASLREYTGSLGALLNLDMHPTHVFRMNFNVGHETGYCSIN